MPSNILETPKSKPTSAPRPKGNAGNERKAAAPNPTSGHLRVVMLALATMMATTTMSTTTTTTTTTMMRSR